MKALFYRFRAAVTIAWVAFRHPVVMADSHFLMLSALYERILNVQKSRRPSMFKVGVVLPDSSSHDVATVWVGAGASSTPTDRIGELINENAALRDQLKKYLEQIQQLQNNPKSA